MFVQPLSGCRESEKEPGPSKCPEASWSCVTTWQVYRRTTRSQESCCDCPSKQMETSSDVGRAQKRGEQLCLGFESSLSHWKLTHLWERPIISLTSIICAFRHTDLFLKLFNFSSPRTFIKHGYMKKQHQIFYCHRTCIWKTLISNLLWKLEGYSEEYSYDRPHRYSSQFCSHYHTSYFIPFLIAPYWKYIQFQV